MSLQSMTGFARVASQNESFQWSWELRSVNGKGLDMRFRIPPGWERLDPIVRATMQKTFKRGSMSINLDLKPVAGQQQLMINKELLEQLVSACKENGEEPRMDRLLNIRGVLEMSDDKSDAANDEALQKGILASLNEAISSLKSHREEEGKRTFQMLETHIDKIAELVPLAAGTAGAQPQAIRDKIQGQIDELISKNNGIDEDRLAQEAAILAVKADIREESDRLGAHIKAARDLLSQGNVICRKLDFLCQEFNREANTLCSKSSDIKLTQIGLELKATIDQLREQAANIE